MPFFVLFPSTRPFILLSVFSSSRPLPDTIGLSGKRTFDGQGKEQKIQCVALALPLKDWTQLWSNGSIASNQTAKNKNANFTC